MRGRILRAGGAHRRVAHDRGGLQPAGHGRQRRGHRTADLRREAVPKAGLPRPGAIQPHREHVKHPRADTSCTNNTHNTLAGSIASQADSAADRCADDPNWHSTMGETFTCSTYTDVRGSNHPYCGEDSDGANVLAEVACPGELLSAIRHESRNFLACVLKCQQD